MTTRKKETREGGDGPLPEAFASMGLSKPLLKALGRMHWTEPTEVQEKLIPVALEGKDVLGQARTGTGKTAAFGLPIFERMPTEDGVRCLVLAPTRELAAQVGDEMERLGRFTPHKVVVAYGGTRIVKQAEKLRRNPAIVVGTPGRIMDLMQRGMLSLKKLRFAVLDEVDRMLDIGFRDDIRKILGGVRSRPQTIFVSATIDDEINRLARRYMSDPVEIFCSGDTLTVDEVEQYYLTAEPWDKRRLLVALIQEEKPEQAIVFTRTKRATARVAQALRKAGVDAQEIHGDLMQHKRQRILRSFRQGQLHVLVATDVASRGLDIDDISHVINYDIPEDPEVYVHRIGRTARMGQSGKAFTFVTTEQGDELTEIEMLINHEVTCRKLEGFEPSQRPHGDRGRPTERRGAAGRKARRRR